MEKREYELICKVGNISLIKYQKKCIGDEYVIAPNFDEENFSWDSGSDNYWYSVEDALAALAYRLGSDMVKSKTQRHIEHKTDISYERMSEIASKVIDGLREDDEESAIEYLECEVELTDSEKKYFGVSMKSEDD